MRVLMTVGFTHTPMYKAWTEMEGMALQYVLVSVITVAPMAETSRLACRETGFISSEKLNQVAL